MPTLRQKDIDEINKAFEFNGAENNKEIRDAFQKVLADLTAVDKGYKEYTGLITQAGAAAPTVTVLKNDFDENEFTWARLNIGAYSLNSASGLFLEDKVWFKEPKAYNVSTQVDHGSFMTRANDSLVLLGTFYHYVDATPELLRGELDGLLTNQSFSVRIYD